MSGHVMLYYLPRRVRRFLIVPIRAWNLGSERHLGLFAAGVAFYSILAVFPAMAALVAIWGFFADPHVVAANMAGLSEFLPPDAFQILNAQVEGLVNAGSTTLGWTTVISLGAALWSARAGIAALVQGINAIFGTTQYGGIWHQVVSLGLTLAMVGAAVVALAAGIVLPVALALVPLGPAEAWAASILRWSIAPLATIMGVGMVYRYGPNLPGQRPRLFSIGLLVAVALWLAASGGFSWYLTNFANYNKVYGSIGAVIALLMWLYLSAWAVLMGASVNAAWHQRHRA